MDKLSKSKVQNILVSLERTNLTEKEAQTIIYYCRGHIKSLRGENNDKRSI